MIQFYKPNSKNTGSGCSFKISVQDECIYVNLIKQASWDESKKRGSFAGNAQNPKMSVSVKLSSTEAGEIISAIRRNGEFSGFHDSPKQVVRIKFSPYNRPNKDNPQQLVQVGFSFSVSKESKENANDKTSFLMGFTFGESVKLEAFLSLALVKFFEKAVQEQDNKAATRQPQVQQPSQPEKQASEPTASDDDLW
jgi:hypothetical protein